MCEYVCICVPAWRGGGTSADPTTEAALSQHLISLAHCIELEECSGRPGAMPAILDAGSGAAAVGLGKLGRISVPGGGGRSFPGSCGSPHCPAFSGPGAEHRVLQGSQRQCPSVTRCPGRDTAPSCGRSSRASCSRDPSVRTSQGGGRRPRPQKGGGREKGRARRAEWHSCKASASDGRRNVQSSAAPGDAVSDPLSHRACRFDEHRSPLGAEGGHLG